MQTIHYDKINAIPLLKKIFYKQNFIFKFNVAYQQKVLMISACLPLRFSFCPLIFCISSLNVSKLTLRYKNKLQNVSDWKWCVWHLVYLCISTFLCCKNIMKVLFHKSIISRKKKKKNPMNSINNSFIELHKQIQLLYKLFNWLVQFFCCTKLKYIVWWVCVSRLLIICSNINPLSVWNGFL